MSASDRFSSTTITTCAGVTRLDALRGAAAAELVGVAAEPGGGGRVVPDLRGRVELRAGCHLREPAVAEPAGPPVGRRGLRTEPDRDRPLDRQGRYPGADHLLVLAAEGDTVRRPERPQQL